jgi:hypothetical protein
MSEFWQFWSLIKSVSGASALQSGIPRGAIIAAHAVIHERMTLRGGDKTGMRWELNVGEWFRKNAVRRPLLAKQSEQSSAGTFAARVKNCSANYVS